MNIPNNIHHENIQYVEVSKEQKGGMSPYDMNLWKNLIGIKPPKAEETIREINKRINIKNIKRMNDVIGKKKQPKETQKETKKETPTETPTETQKETQLDPEENIRQIRDSLGRKKQPTETPTETQQPTETQKETPTETQKETPTETPTETQQPTETPTETQQPTETPTETQTNTKNDLNNMKINDLKKKKETIVDNIKELNEQLNKTKDIPSNEEGLTKKINDLKNTKLKMESRIKEINDKLKNKKKPMEEEELRQKIDDLKNKKTSMEKRLKEILEIIKNKKKKRDKLDINLKETLIDKQKRYEEVLKEINNTEEGINFEVETPKKEEKEKDKEEVQQYVIIDKNSFNIYYTIYESLKDIPIPETQVVQIIKEFNNNIIRDNKKELYNKTLFFIYKFLETTIDMNIPIQKSYDKEYILFEEFIVSSQKKNNYKILKNIKQDHKIDFAYFLLNNI